MTTGANLVFGKRLPVTGDLVFGQPLGVWTEAQVSLTASLPAPTFSAEIVRENSVRVTASLPAPTMAAHVAPSMTAIIGGPRYLTLEASLPAPTMQAYVGEPRSVTVTASLPAPTMSATVHYDNAVSMRMQSGARSAWQVATEAKAYREDIELPSTHAQAYKGESWQDAGALGANITDNAQPSTPVRTGPASGWQDGTKAGADILSSFSGMIRVPSIRNESWRDGTLLRGDHAGGWQDRNRTKRPTLAEWWQTGVPIRTSRRDKSTQATPSYQWRQEWWQESRLPLPGHYGRPPIVPPTIRISNANLLFSTKLPVTANLVFGSRTATPDAAVVVPVRRTYIVLNTLQLTRVDGSVDIPCFAMTLKIDMDTWTWGFTATVPADQLSNLQPAGFGEPVELDAAINGTHYRVFAEGLQRDRQFGQLKTISITGRGISAVLSEPYAPTQTFTSSEDRTAQQLMNDALTVGGVSLGWTIDWRITDWLVPVGAWSHMGTYMTALNTIAQAGGAFIQPDPSSKTLRVRPRYPAAPWDWGDLSPDFELPTSVMTKESITWADKPAYNAVYVSGTNAGGVLGYIKRTGTAGDLLAPMVSDALTTHADAARQRGIAVLSDTGRIATPTLSLPVLSETGIIEPGSLIRYVDGSSTTLALVKSTAVDARRPAVRQTLEIEAHV